MRRIKHAIGFLIIAVPVGVIFVRAAHQFTFMTTTLACILWLILGAAIGRALDYLFS